MPSFASRLSGFERLFMERILCLLFGFFDSDQGLMGITEPGALHIRQSDSKLIQ
jgi:hypothetical protein